MQKIIIKNFGPVKDAEIEIKKVLVLIGEQASGKSTIAKLIYFFQCLPNYLRDYFWQYILNNQEKVNKNIESEILSFINNKVYSLFGLCFSQESEVIYYYNLKENKYLKLSFDQNQVVNIRFSENFIDQELVSRLETARESYWQHIKNETEGKEDELFFSGEKYRSDFLFLEQYQLSHQFKKQNYNELFMAANRSVTVNYSDLFDKELFASIQNKNEQMSINELIMFEFIKRVSTVKHNLKGFKGFEGIIRYATREQYKRNLLVNITKKIYSILRGRYIIDDSGEMIISNDKVRIDLRESSSGQQEAIRILQDMFIVIHLNQKILRIIEEPEAHLFPVAQKQLIELLALMVNYQPENQLIITTHSPYILTVFSNLLFASRVVEKNPTAEAEVTKIIDKDCWLDPHEFSAYSLGNQSFPEDNAEYCESIFDTEQGNIKQNYLDTVSEILGWEFNSLYRIHSKTFKRR